MLMNKVENNKNLLTSCQEFEHTFVNTKTNTPKNGNMVFSEW